jgi:hypothetical protein
MEPTYTFNIFALPEMVQVILEHYTNLCPVNGKGLSMWLGFGVVCKLFRLLQVQLLTNEAQAEKIINNSNQVEVRPVRQIVQAIQLFQQHKKYPVTIHTQGCNPLIVNSMRNLKQESKIELIVDHCDSTISSYMTYAPHYPTFLDYVRQKSVEAKKLKQECFCLFHFRRGYFGFIIQCKVENVSKKTNIKQSLRIVKVYQTQSVRFYGQVQQEANKHPSVYGAALYFLLKDYVKFDTFYISHSTKRKRDTDEDDGESKVERVPKKAKIDFDHQFYLWKRNDSNFDRHPPTFTLGKREGDEESEEADKSGTPSQCSCTLL